MQEDEIRPYQSKAARPDHGYAPLRYTGLRVGLVCLGLAALSGLIYFLPTIIAGSEAGAGTVSVGFLVFTPLCIGAIASLLADPKGQKSAIFHTVIVQSFILAIILFVGVVALKEGIICLLLLSPIWIMFAALGGFITYTFHQRYYDHVRLKASLLASFAALATLFGPEPFSTARDYTTTSSIIIAAAPDEIWPHLESMQAISAAEGRWTFTQSLLRVPRPVSAELQGRGVGAIRYAQWGENIHFEEHITHYDINAAMTWNFVFTDDSLQNHVDQHIDPDGRHLKIASGGYQLEPLGDGRTKLTLHTSYQIDTQLNVYVVPWSRFMLGDLQTNILDIVKARAEG